MNTPFPGITPWSIYLPGNFLKCLKCPFDFAPFENLRVFDRTFG
jgi:hypothetical protein